MKKTIVPIVLLCLSLFAVIAIPKAFASTIVFPGGSVTTGPGAYGGGSATVYDDTHVSFDVTKADLIVTVYDIDMTHSRLPTPACPYAGWPAPLEVAGIQVGVTPKPTVGGGINPRNSAFYNLLIAGAGGGIGADYYQTQAAYVNNAFQMFENYTTPWDGNILGVGFNTPYTGPPNDAPLGGFHCSGNAAFDTFDMQLTFHYLVGGDVLFTPLIRVHATTDHFSFPAMQWLPTFPAGKVFVIPGTGLTDWTIVKPFVLVVNWGAAAGGGTITWGSVQATGSVNYYLTVNSVDPGTTVGQGWYPENTMANFHVTSPLYYDMVRKLICTGYHGDATGSGTSGSILMDNFHSVTFDWDTYWYITVISAQDTPTASDWVLDDGSFTASVTSPAPGPSGTQYVCTGYKIDGGALTAGTSYTFTHVHDKHTIEFFWNTQYLFTVASAHDTPTPKAVGSYWIDSGTVVASESVTSPADTVGTTRYRCTGYTGTGNLASGSGTSSPSFTITMPTSVTFNWIAQYYLTVKTDPSGIVTIPGQGWYDLATPVTLTAPAGPMSNPFLNWDVDGVSKGSLVNPITVTMNAAHTATAHYYVQGVGGEWAPINTVQLVTPWIAYALLALASAAAVSYRLFKKRW